MSFYVKVTIAVALLVAGAIAFILFSGGSEAEAIERVLREGLAGAQKGDPEAVLRLVSREYRNGGEDYDAVAARIRKVLKDPRPELLVMGKPGILVDGEQAHASVEVTMKAGPHVLAQPRFRFELRKEKEGWKVTSGEEVR